MGRSQSPEGPVAGGTVVRDTVDGIIFAAIAAGYGHSMALDTTGHVYTWGNNQYGQLGIGTTTGPVTTPQDVSGLTITEVIFGTAPATNLNQTGNEWTATTPQSLTCGPVEVTVTYTQFGATKTAATHGGFTYQGTAPTVTTQPASHTLTKGETFITTATATGDPTPTIQWQQSDTGTDPWTNIPDASNTTLKITPSATTHYRAVFTGCGDLAVSDTATVTVQAAPPSPPDTPSGTPTNSTPGPTSRAAGSILPWTGTDPAPLITGAIALLLAGVTLVIAIRRRRTTR